MKTKINVPFEAHLNTDGNGFSFVDHPRVSASCYAGEAKARKYLGKLLAQEVEKALTAQHNSKVRLVGCKDGTVLVVRFGPGGWQYDFAGPGRAQGGCTLMQGGFDDLLAAARKHAESAYGGVAWETSI